MTFKNEIKQLKENRIIIFRYLLIDNKINDLLISHQIKVKDFLKEFMVLLFKNFIRDLNSKSNKSSIFNDTKSFLDKKALSIKNFYYILKIFKNSIHLFLYNQKLDTYLFGKLIDEVFDFYYENLFFEKKKTDNKTNMDEDNYKKLVYENLFFLKIGSNKNIINISRSLNNKYGDIFKKDDNFTKYIENYKYKDDFDEAFKNKKIWKNEIKIIDNSNKIFWFLIKLVPFKEECFYLILNDITLEKNVDTQKKLFLEQSKMAAMGELISMIAHQWRQPLQTISILMQKLILTKETNNYVNNDVLEKSVSDVEIQLSYMSKTIDDFRNFFRPESSEKICRISEIIDKTIKFLHYVLTINNIDIKIQIDNDCEISVLENNIIQVLINLIKNSKDALLEKNPEEKFIFIRADFNENYAIIDVEDNAGGIPEENLEKVFESYFSTKNNDNGTGLGLYMSKTIIEEHCHGKLSVQNSKNGALFRISLPLK